MLWVALAGILVAGAAWVYLVRERLGVAGLGLSLLRALALGTTVALLVNATAKRVATVGPRTVALDASLSMQASGTPWRTALDTAMALAGRHGRLVRFGDAVAPFDSSPPRAGHSSVADVLRIAAASGGSAVIVTDGELDDFLTQPSELRERAELVVLPRAAGPGLALTEAAVPAHLLTDDSLPITIEITAWGGLPDSSAVLEVATAGRLLARRTVGIPVGAGRVRRRVVVPPRTLQPGPHALELTIRAAGDPEPRDNARVRVVEVAAVPAVVVIGNPPTWEARFVTRELKDIAAAGVYGFGEIAPGRWIDLQSQRAVPAARVREAARRAGVVVSLGAVDDLPPGRNAWRWDGAPDAGALAGDWYLASTPPSSPLLGRLAGIPWDSLPPVHDLPAGRAPAGLVILTARLGRRGAARPILVAREANGRRELITTAAGLWRWAFRGGVAREAYRSVLAAGLEWLLGAPSGRRGAQMEAVAVVPRGVPVTFRWIGDRVPTAPVEVEVAGPDTTFAAALTFTTSRAATLQLPVGVYRWRAPAGRAAGLVAVEGYSDEFVPRPAVARRVARVQSAATAVGLRQVWWGVVVAMLAFMAEWAWRTRRGLP